MKSNETVSQEAIPQHPPDPVRIRGHMLLCLQGFRGEGYGTEFIQNMAAIHRALNENPGRIVRVTQSPDHICQSCPHLKSGDETVQSDTAHAEEPLMGCTLRGPGFETHIVTQDAEVLKRLGLKNGQELTWEEAQSRIGSRMHPNMLDDICGDCQWLSLGYCKEGIKQLQKTSDINRA